MVYFHSFNSTCKCTVTWDENFKRTTALIFHWKVCDFENGRTVLGTAGLRFRLVAGAAAPERAAWGRRFSPWCPAHLQTPALFPPKPVRNASTHDTQKPSSGPSSDLPSCTTRLCAQPPLANSSQGLPSEGAAQTACGSASYTSPPLVVPIARTAARGGSPMPGRDAQCLLPCTQNRKRPWSRRLPGSCIEANAPGPAGGHPASVSLCLASLACGAPLTA